MRFLELRRHSLRIRPDEHLSQEGITLARRVGGALGPFATVITSPSPRAFETAIAMGFGVDRRYEPVIFTPAEWKGLDRLMPEGTGFSTYARVMRQDPLAAEFAHKLAAQWISVARSLPKGTAALVITHGGYIDASGVACLDQADHARWGPPFAHCEGIRLAFDTDRFIAGELLRVSCSSPFWT